MNDLKRRTLGVCIALIALAGAAGCRSLPTPDFSPPTPSLSAVTYNVNWGCSNPGAVVGFLEAALAGFVFGYVLARTANLVVDAAAGWFIRECELAGLSDPLAPDPE